MNKVLQSLRLSLLHVGQAQLDANWDYDNVISTFSRLYLVTEGKAKVYHSYEEVDLRPGHLYLVPSLTYSRYQCESHLEQYYIHFLEEVGDGLSIYDLKDFVYELEAAELDVKYFKRLIELHPNRHLKTDDPRVYDNRSTLSDLRKENDLLSAATLLETQGLLQLLYARFIKDGQSRKTQVRSDFNDVLNYIKEHLHEKLSISDLAKHYNLTADHFSRVFQQKFGIRPSKYIQTVRIERSETLLLTTNNSLAQIAEKTGWDNVSYYTRMFKKVTGKTPGQFRKERLNN